LGGTVRDKLALEHSLRFLGWGEEEEEETKEEEMEEVTHTLSNCKG
jgi:hypothetical protein